MFIQNILQTILNNKILYQKFLCRASCAIPTVICHFYCRMLNIHENDLGVDWNVDTEPELVHGPHTAPYSDLRLAGHGCWGETVTLSQSLRGILDSF